MVLLFPSVTRSNCLLKTPIHESYQHATSVFHKSWQRILSEPIIHRLNIEIDPSFRGPLLHMQFPTENCRSVTLHKVLRRLSPYHVLDMALRSSWKLLLRYTADRLFSCNGLPLALWQIILISRDIQLAHRSSLPGVDRRMRRKLRELAITVCRGETIVHTYITY